MTPPTPPPGGPPPVPPAGGPPSPLPRPLPRALPRPKRGRPRLKPLRDRNPIGVAAVGIVILLVLGTLAYRADRLPLIGGGTTYSAYFSEAAGLDPGQEVRVAGVKVGKVTGVSLKGNKVKVTFRVKDTWVGNATRATIMIKTLLGSKYLQLDPLGYRRQNPEKPIPLDRTVAPYDVTTAFQDLGRTFEQLDTTKLAQSLETISTTFEDTPASVRVALHGLSALSTTIASRDAELSRLLAGTKQLSGTIAAQNSQFETLFKDGNLLLGELRRRRDAIHALLVGTQRLGTELVGLVDDNRRTLGPTLASLERVVGVLQRNQKNLERVLTTATPYIRVLGNATGNGRWVDGYLCGTVPEEYLVNGRWQPEDPDRCKPPHLTGGR
ncbi:MCE family protein [Actinomadura citrea]|uniref:Phospholipid/cholesterol/gamma-HCH transport system substrate-binding protein n=1 Tax=Actinomadura citrea TaxID=46158 RepID=A0A7Y9GHM8_9ACTN|nr:MCE family protein [Actinomadura citrea]NYE16654.1 phospholipid/cholesterol/gamma-HCH transport system substrate-binding protein [Actinomadura citrea]GGT57081.1 ABC transporter substrate-binding protein [Actinomadura citrea]